MIRYTCIHCGHAVDLPDERQNSVFTCPACQFSNWVSGMMVQQLDDRQTRQGAGARVAPPQPRPAATPQPRPTATPQLRPVAPPSHPSHSAPPPRTAEPLNRPAPKPPAATPTASRPVASSTDAASKRPAGPLSHEQISQWLKTPPKNPPPLPPKADGGLNLELQQNAPPPVQPGYYKPKHSTSYDRDGIPICPQATASLLVGLFSMLALGCPNFLAVVPGTLAIFLGLKARSKISSAPTEFSGMGLAAAGIILGVLNIVIALFVLGRGCGH